MRALDSVFTWDPGSDVSTCDVANGLKAGLQAQGVRVISYPMAAAITAEGKKLTDMALMTGYPRPGPVSIIYHAAKPLLAEACRARRMHGTEWVLIVSGMYQHPDIIVFLKDCGFKVAVLLTESPYDTEYEMAMIDRRELTGNRAPVADVVFTNERTVLPQLRAIQPNTHYLAHAWNAHLTPADPAALVGHDVVFVATYFEERIQFLSDIDWRDINLGLYGGTDEIVATADATIGPARVPQWARRGWERCRGVTTDLQRRARRLEPFIAGDELPNATTLALYRKAKIGLNLHRTSKGFNSGGHVTTAESLNPRCYELASQGTFFISDARAELEDVLPMVPTCRTPQDATALIRRALCDVEWRLTIAQQAREAIAGHTWDARAKTVVEVLSGARVSEAVCA